MIRMNKPLDGFDERIRLIDLALKQWLFGVIKMWF